MELLLSSSENKLCANCMRLLQRFHDATQVQGQDRKRATIFNGKHHEDGESFFAAAKNGCRICHILLSFHLRAQGSLDNGFRTDAIISVSDHPSIKASSGNIILTIRHQGQIWEPNGQYTQLRSTIHLEGDPSYERLKWTCRALPLSESTDDPAVIALANQWLSSCDTKSPGHQSCITPRRRAFQPARLLDVSGGTVRLSLKSERIEEEPYCALSYCWGTSRQVILTAYNEEDLSRSIEFDTLPKSITDAIRVTRSLGIRYIWVDSLCIIQAGDSGKDWTYHSTQMSEIYSNCILNLSADRASAAQEGFLGQRAWPPIRPVFNDGIIGLSTPQRKCVITFTNVADMALATEPLGSRAWILSERMLSPRTLHFGAGEMFWECPGCAIASESCPKGYHTFLENYSYAKFELSDRASEKIHDWIQILTNYTLLSLTMPASDKLVALAGVGRLYEKHTKNTLVAGIIKDTLPQSLLWEREVFSSPEFKRSPKYRAPSWSWASFDGPLGFYMSREIFGRSKNIAEVLDVWTKPVEGHDHLGQIEDGAITICGPAISLIELESLVSLRQTDWRLGLYWDEPDDQKSKDITFLIFLTVTYPANIHSNDAKGLLVTPGRKEGTWVRVGVSSMRFEDNANLEHFPFTVECHNFLEERDKKAFTII
ncbi:hypothetical protein CJF32_00010832 [Rutstroemia sp. NJR-2017a WRK4]|nr:hypothetical protein CJF32_00010832 [Rutstroemia sp. NJR-2017a WRK4]